MGHRRCEWAESSCAGCARTVRHSRSGVTSTRGPFLLDAHPLALFITPHYDTSPMVIVALPRVDAELVRELVEDARAERAPRKLLDAYRAEHGRAGDGGRA